MTGFYVKNTSSSMNGNGKMLKTGFFEYSSLIIGRILFASPPKPLKASTKKWNPFN